METGLDFRSAGADQMSGGSVERCKRAFSARFLLLASGFFMGLAAGGRSIKDAKSRGASDVAVTSSSSWR